jgi:hypothetical protein
MSICPGVRVYVQVHGLSVPMFMWKVGVVAQEFITSKVKALTFNTKMAIPTIKGLTFERFKNWKPSTFESFNSNP